MGINSAVLIPIQKDHAKECNVLKNNVESTTYERKTKRSVVEHKGKAGKPINAVENRKNRKLKKAAFKLQSKNCLRRGVLKGMPSRKGRESRAEKVEGNSATNLD